MSNTESMRGGGCGGGGYVLLYTTRGETHQASLRTDTWADSHPHSTASENAVVVVSFLLASLFAWWMAELQKVCTPEFRSSFEKCGGCGDYTCLGLDRGLCDECNRLVDMG